MPSKRPRSYVSYEDNSLCLELSNKHWHIQEGWELYIDSEGNRTLRNIFGIPIPVTTMQALVDEVCKRNRRPSFKVKDYNEARFDCVLRLLNPTIESD